jgi:ferric-dicitrate binding protein FerR (iron transport regulator)
MEITNSLIRKFFANRCDEQEFEAVMEYFELHPEEAAKEMGLEEWAATDPLPAVPVDNQEEVLVKLKERLFQQQMRAGPVRYLRRIAVAASLLLAVGGWIFISKNKAQNKRESITGGPVRQRSAKAVWTYRTNSTERTANILLPDGSAVKLYAHSTLRYTDSFGLSRRESWLGGGAEFLVKKDKAHPFTVYSGSLATTVLGTSFGVQATGAGSETVKLFSGRVVVRSTRPVKGWRDIYLLPGQQVKYDDRRMLATIGKFGKAAERGEREKAVDDKELVFSNSPLKNVFRRLTIQYNKKFIFRASDLTGLNFTGTVPRTDSLDVFLRLLAGMNDLDILEQPDGYIVTRRR